jgi:hypothetical protein
MSNKNGLLAPTATHGALNPSYYALENGGILQQPTVIQPLRIKAADASGSTATIFVDPLTSGAYQGAVNITPGGNALVPTGSAGITIRAAPGGGLATASTIVEIGTNGEGPNELYIAGASGVGQVYDEVYNQPVQLQTITIVATNPVCAPTGGAEVFRCAQAGVAAAFGPPLVYNRIQVPKTGAYMMQTEYRLGNGPGANTVVLPSNLVGGVPQWFSLQVAMQEFGTVISVPYSSFEVIGGDFQAVETFQTNSIMVRTYSVVVFLDSTKVYTVGLVSNNATWNIGSAGQVKVELIAMC